MLEVLVDSTVINWETIANIIHVPQILTPPALYYIVSMRFLPWNYISYTKHFSCSGIQIKQILSKENYSTGPGCCIYS